MLNASVVNSFTKCGMVEPDPDLMLSDLLLTPQLEHVTLCLISAQVPQHLPQPEISLACGQRGCRCC